MITHLMITLPAATPHQAPTETVPEIVSACRRQLRRLRARAERPRRHPPARGVRPACLGGGPGRPRSPRWPPPCTPPGPVWAIARASPGRSWALLGALGLGTLSWPPLADDHLCPSRAAPCPDRAPGPGGPTLGDQSGRHGDEPREQHAIPPDTMNTGHPSRARMPDSAYSPGMTPP